MLIRFGCSNYRSISDYQEINLTATSLKDSQSDVINSEGFNKSLLSSAAIYGANASGKTNLLFALRKLVNFVRNSHRRAENTGISRNVFKLSSDSRSLPSVFDIDFICNEQHYQYGLKLNDEFVLEEWLYSYSYSNRASKKVLFHRSKEEEEEFHFGKSLKGRNKVIQDLVRPNSLFLSVAAQNNHEVLGEIYNYFLDKVNFRFDQETHEMSIAKKLSESEHLDQIVEFLESLDTGVKSIKICEREVSDRQKVLRKKIQEAIFNDMPEEERVDLPTIDIDLGIDLFHKSNSGELIKFELDDESLGTKSVIALLIPVFRVINSGGVLIVDEIESSLHPILTLKILSLFSRKDTNRLGAQLVFSTHETNVLCNDNLRRDQIWLTEKSLNGNTVLTPLTDFHLRKEYDIQTGYLEGRFGAIPFFGDIGKLFTNDDVENA